MNPSVGNTLSFGQGSRSNRWKLTPSGSDLAVAGLRTFPQGTPQQVAGKVSPFKGRLPFLGLLSCDVITSHPDLPPCAGCGSCCHLVVALAPGDLVPAELVVEHAGVRCLEQRGDGACVALDPVTRLCTIYAQRPQTCRDFGRGGDLCRRILARAASSRALQACQPPALAILSPRRPA